MLWIGADTIDCRYSAFVVLYPPGFLSEAWLVYVCLTQAGKGEIGPLYRGYLFAGLMSYLPCEFVHVLL
ncbi:MAG: hypothetical protein CL912_21850 [Deltaproteobacteria bacterium]|nr:hypothetical protein [Deltaproteobacteria bacterium]